RPGTGDRGDDLVELLLHVHRVLATLYSCVGDGRDDCTAPARRGDTDRRIGGVRPGRGRCSRSASVRAQAVGQGCEDLRRHQVGDVAAPGGDLLDQGGRQEAVGGVGGDEEGL